MQDLVQTYKPRNVPEIIAAKTVEFWGSTKRLPSESIDSYYNHFQELPDDLSDVYKPNCAKGSYPSVYFYLRSGIRDYSKQLQNQ